MAAISKTKPAAPSGGRSAPPPLIAVDRDSDMPVFRQIYQALRESILAGQLVQGSRLPPSRALADELGVARTTVVLAYEHLEAEGYVTGRGSAGTFVAVLPLPVGRLPPRPLKSARRSAPLSPAARDEMDYAPLQSAPLPFRIGEPALDEFPLRLWTRLQGQAARGSARSMLGYGDPAGYLPLRRAIAEYVGVSRGVSASTEQVILVRGAQQAMDLAARVLLRPGDKAWVEDPGYLANRSLVELAGATPVPVPVDAEGLVVEAGIRAAPDARMACMAPSHHFPLGRTLSLARRLALLDWAQRADAWVVEDDFDSEFRYTGFPIASLQGLDTSGRVIYIGTFSKTLYPALRLGYLIPPPELVGRFLDARRAIDHLAPTLEQVTLTEFIEGGHFTRHVRRMRALYRERQEILLEAAARELPGLLRVDATDTGMHALGWLLQRGADDAAVSRAARLQGIEAPPLSRYCLRAKLPPAILLGFAALRPEELQAGVRALRSVLRPSG